MVAQRKIPLSAMTRTRLSPRVSHLLSSYKMDLKGIRKVNVDGIPEDGVQW
jgi:hypothetical protein